MFTETFNDILDKISGDKMLKSNQFGTTMMEAIAAISVVTVLTVAAVKLIGNMFEMFRQNMVANEVQEIQKNIATRYRLEGNYAELSSEKMTPQKMREEQLIPSQMLIGGKIVHRLNGEVEIKTSSLGSEYFDITFKDLSLRTCMNLSQLSWNNIQGTDLFQIKINNKVFKLPINGVKFGDDNALPITVKNASNNCKDNGKNIIIWTFQ